MTWSRSARIPPKVDGQPGLKSKRSFMAVGTPCSGPSASPDVTAASAARALSMAWSKSVNTNALRLGLRRSMRWMVELISSTGDSSRRRMRPARSAADVQELSSGPAIAVNFDRTTKYIERRARDGARRRPGSTPDLSAIAREKSADVGGVEPEQVAVQGHLQRAHGQPSFETELERAFVQSPDEAGHERVAGSYAVHGLDRVAAPPNGRAGSRRDGPFRAEREHDRADAEACLQMCQHPLGLTGRPEKVACVLCRADQDVDERSDIASGRRRCVRTPQALAIVDVEGDHGSAAASRLHRLPGDVLARIGQRQGRCGCGEEAGAPREAAAVR